MTSQKFDLGPKPKFVEGGCLCGALRYRLDFPPGHDFAAASMLCQCTMCRKGTSSLFFAAHRVAPASSFRWLAAPAALKSYSASPGRQRGFCGECGSQIYWRRDDRDRISVAVGTVDALYLFGEGADGVEVPEDGFGRALISGMGMNEWAANAIKGVTDDMPLLCRGKVSTADDSDDD